ncbi:MAG: 30S ribosomal protein S6 [Candidatus Magasanikbacteria bacterium]|nr:30S ribosomal protein S6 [Candidatus Magasanikbacteria bacterium]
MVTYELVYLLPSEKTEEETQKIKKDIHSLILKLGGEIKGEESPLGKRRLAYPIRKKQFTSYQIVQFDFPPKKMVDLEKELKLDENILRHQLVKYQKMEIGPSRVKIWLRQRTSLPETVVAAPMVGAAAEQSPKLSLGELDKKLEEILTGEEKGV